jgi:addiction module HigA family antidote
MAHLGNPYTPIYPGEIVKDELEYRKISQLEFARKTGVSYTLLNEVLNGKRPMSIEFALITQKALGISAGLLLRLQTSYNLQIAEKDKSLLSRLKKIPRIAAVL